MPKYGNWFGSYPIISDNPPAIVAFLDVEAAPFKLHLDVFIALNFDTLHRQCRRRQQALHGVQMLKQEAAMHGFDPHELGRIQDIGWALRRLGQTMPPLCEFAVERHGWSVAVDRLFDGGGEGEIPLFRLPSLAKSLDGFGGRVDDELFR